MNRKVLVVSYFYPPYQSIGAIRVSKFTKYLPDFGWDPIVLTAENDYAQTLPLVISPERVYRTGQFDINRLPKLLLGRRKVRHAGYTAEGSSIKSTAMSAGRSVIRHVVNFPDGQIGWYRHAISAGRKIIAREKPEVIFSSALPPTSHLVAARLAKEFGLPWVAEFRDMWTDNHNFRRIQPPPRHGEVSGIIGYVRRS